MIHQLLYGWAAVALVMMILWVIQQRTRNAGIVDIAWSFGVGILAAAFAALGSGTPVRRLLLAGLALGWSIRLGVHLWTRVFSEEEDGRYAALRKEWGESASNRFFFFFQLQASWTVAFALPVLLAAGNESPFGLLDILGAGIWLLAVTGEAVADRQLAKFRSDPANRGKVCERGLWGWSRHPNYFFEWLHWWAWVAIGWGAPLGWLTLAGPLVMLLFLLRVTGIPYTEAQAISSRGELYRDYQQRVSAFIPLPPRKGLQT